MYSLSVDNLREVINRVYFEIAFTYITPNNTGYLERYKPSPSVKFYKLLELIIMKFAMYCDGHVTSGYQEDKNLKKHHI